MAFKKKYWIMLIPIAYLVFALFFFFLVSTGVTNTLPHAINEISFDNSSFNETFRSELTISLILTQNFTVNNLVSEDGFVYLSINPNKDEIDESQTNSEALSYIIYWSAVDKNKNQFDHELAFIEKNMQHPDKGYFMWRLESDRKAILDGRNSATDAELRTIKALLVADEYWIDKRYREKIDELTQTLTEIAITDDKFFAPYAGVSESGEVWKTNDVWLSYADFTVFRELAYTKGEPWRAVYSNMKKAFLASQLQSGLYQSGLNENREYYSLDGNYSINSLWMMVRAAESEDLELQQSARGALSFYRASFYDKGLIYTSYTSKGQPASSDDAPWVYALVGRAAISLGDEEFSADMMRKMMTFQNTDQNSSLYGAFVEGSKDNPIVTQFTHQESIITLQTYLEKMSYRTLDGKMTN